MTSTQTDKPAKENERTRQKPKRRRTRRLPSGENETSFPTTPAPSDARRRASASVITASTLNAVAALTWTSTILFVFTAVIGMVVSYNLVRGYDRFFLLIVGLLIAVAMVWLSGPANGELVAGAAAAGAGLLAGLLGLYFLLASDWTAVASVKFGLLQQIGLLIQSLRPSVPIPDDLNANVAASGLVLLIPLGFGGYLWLRNRPAAPPLVGILTLAATLFGLFALLISVSRGGWLGLAGGALFAAYAWWRSGPGRTWSLRWLVDLLVVLSVLALIGSFIAILLLPEFSGGPLGRLSVGGTSVSRASLWRDVLSLLGDYRFTGSGLGGTDMILSTYLFLLHVPFLTHAHNLYLQIGLEQGLPGLVAFLGIVVGSGLMLAIVLGKGEGERRLLATATVAALVAMLLHGFFDAGIYASKMVVLLFIPFGLAWSIRLRSLSRSSSKAKKQGGRIEVIAAILMPLAIILLLFVLPGARSGFQADLGAVAQTRAELSVYSWPAWPLQDELRRTGAADLEQAIRRYGAALIYDPDDVTARRRLGQLVLASGDLDAARVHLERAYAMAPQDRVTRQLLGEVYALGGETERAAELLRSVDTGSGQLNARMWWYENRGTPEQAAALQRAILASASNP